MGLSFDLGLLKEQLESLVSIFLPGDRGGNETMCLVIRKRTGKIVSEEMAHLFCDEPMTFEQSKVCHWALSKAREFIFSPSSLCFLSEVPGSVRLVVSGEEIIVSFAGMAKPRADEYIALWVLSQVLEHDDENFLKVVERSKNPYVQVNGGVPSHLLFGHLNLAPPWQDVVMVGLCFLFCFL